MKDTKKFTIVKYLLTLTQKYGILEKVNAPELAKKFGVTRQYIYKCFKIYQKTLSPKK